MTAQEPNTFTISASGGGDGAPEGYYAVNVFVRVDGTGQEPETAGWDSLPSATELVEADPDGFAQHIVDWFQSKLPAATPDMVLSTVTKFGSQTLHP